MALGGIRSNDHRSQNRGRHNRREDCSTEDDQENRKNFSERDYYHVERSRNPRHDRYNQHNRKYDGPQESYSNRDHYNQERRYNSREFGNKSARDIRYEVQVVKHIGKCMVILLNHALLIFIFYDRPKEQMPQRKRKRSKKRKHKGKSILNIKLNFFMRKQFLKFSSADNFKYFLDFFCSF